MIITILASKIHRYVYLISKMQIMHRLNKIKILKRYNVRGKIEVGIPTSDSKRELLICKLANNKESIIHIKIQK